MGSCRGGGLCLEREEADEMLRYYQTASVMHTDLSEDEYSELCVREMESRAREKQRNPLPERDCVVIRSAPRPARMWTSCEDPQEGKPEPLRRK